MMNMQAFIQQLQAASVPLPYMNWMNVVSPDGQQWTLDLFWSAEQGGPLGGVLVCPEHPGLADIDLDLNAEAMIQGIPLVYIDLDEPLGKQVLHVQLLLARGNLMELAARLAFNASQLYDHAESPQIVDARATRIKNTAQLIMDTMCLLGTARARAQQEKPQAGLAGTVYLADVLGGEGGPDEG